MPPTEAALQVDQTALETGQPPPWVQSQPGEGGCDTCIYDRPPDGFLHVTLLPGINDQLQSMTLQTFSGSVSTSYTLQADAFPDAFWTPVTAPGVDSAMITFVLKSGRVMRDPVITLVGK
jgi:hypothetical protein